MKAPPEADATNDVHEATCLGCGHYVAVPFFDGGHQPLATLGRPITGPWR